MSGAAAAARTATPGPWWAIAVTLLAAALALVIAGLAGKPFTGHLVEGAPSLSVAGDHFKPGPAAGGIQHGGVCAGGTRHRRDWASCQPGCQPFAAESYPRVEWHLRGAELPEDEAVVRSGARSNSPKRKFHVELEWEGGDVAYAESHASRRLERNDHRRRACGSGQPGAAARGAVLDRSVRFGMDCADARSPGNGACPFRSKARRSVFPSTPSATTTPRCSSWLRIAQGLALAAYYLLAQTRRMAARCRACSGGFPDRLALARCPLASRSVAAARRRRRDSSPARPPRRNTTPRTITPCSS